MDLSLNDDQRQIVEAARIFLAKEWPLPDLVRDTLAFPGTVSPRQDALWQKMAALGWIGLGLAPDDGGIGYSVIEEMLLAREAGSSLIPLVLLSTMIGVQAAHSAGDRTLVEAAVSGAARIAMAVPSGTSLFLRCHCTAAQAILVFERGGTYLVPVHAFRDEEVTESLDPTTSLRMSRLQQHEHRIDAPDLGVRAAILAAAALCGIAETCCALSVEHAKAREQFGRPIGSFQAIKHRCSGMKLSADAAYAETCFAAAALKEHRSDSAFHALAAFTLAQRAALANARHLIQILGAMGITNEHPAHLFLKRAHVMAALFSAAHPEAQSLLA